jgi:uncharacterized protein
MVRIGVVPFRMAGVRARGLPEVPGTNNFLELNLRTYVTDGSRPGVWFFSLDCENPLAVRGARVGFSLPYFDAQMRSPEIRSLEIRSHGIRSHGIRTARVDVHDSESSGFEYASRRTHRGFPSASFRAKYAPNSSPFFTKPGTLEHWLTSRYCLYAQRPSGRVIRGEILHQPWALQSCEVELLENTLCDSLGFTLPSEPPLAHFAKRLEVQAWLPTGI